LKEEHAGRPDGRGAAEFGQDDLAHERLDKKQEGRADKQAEREEPDHGHSPARDRAGSRNRHLSGRAGRPPGAGTVAGRGYRLGRLASSSAEQVSSCGSKQSTYTRQAGQATTRFMTRTHGRSSSPAVHGGL